MQIRCPTCNKLTTWKENDFRPFCSERCKLIDLGMWASEQYRIIEPAESITYLDKNDEIPQEDKTQKPFSKDTDK